jgi:hypothetical protein
MLELGAGVVLGVVALGWYWWIFLAGIILFSCAYAHSDVYLPGTVAILGGICVISYFGADVNPFKWIWNHPGDTLFSVTSYTLIGCLWSVGKWWLHLKRCFRGAEEKHEAKMVSQLKDIAGGYTQGPEPKKVRPSTSYAKNNKSRLIGWIFHWPFSMLGVILGDLLRNIATAVYDVLYGLFERMALTRFRGYSDD